MTTIIEKLDSIIAQATALKEEFSKVDTVQKPTKIINQSNNSIEYRINGVLHRDEEEGPAIIYADGNYAYYKNGVIHRTKGPALKATTFEAWYTNGFCHRDEEEGPAIAYTNGNYLYYYEGKIHRTKGPAEKYRKCVTYYVNGKIHRDEKEGPAVIWDNGDYEYRTEGLLHRGTGGFAYSINGKKGHCLNGIEYQSFSQYYEALSTEQKAYVEKILQETNTPD